MAVEPIGVALEGEPGPTMLELWREAGARASDQPLFLVKEGPEWRGVGWQEASARVDELAAGFLELGLGKGDRAAILSRTRLEWTLCDYALASIGVVVVPIYETSSREDCAYLLSDSGAHALICEDAEQLEKTAGLDLPALRLTVAFEDADERAVALDSVSERGRSFLARRPESLTEARASVSPSDPLTLIYTSGTTGDPKGCVLTHANWAALVDSVRRLERLMMPRDVALLFLPLAHNFARLIQFAGVGIGVTIAFVPDVERVGRALLEVRPTLLPSVPRLFERAYSTVKGRLERERGFRRRLVGWALSVGRRSIARRQRGRRIGLLLALQLRVADQLVFSKITQRFGGRLRYAISGGAPLPAEISEFFSACGVVILEGYGLTETTSACAVNRPDDFRFGTVGLAMPGVELGLAADGEIKVRGDGVFQGYHGKEAATAEVLTDDGWLLTGDIGTIDDEGFVTIVDRKKELIVTSGGKKISPAKLENALKASPYVSQALVVGDNRSYLVALIAANGDEVAKAATTVPEVRALVQGVIDEVNSHLGPVEQIKRFAVLPREFSAERGEITPTLKLKRKVCEENFREEIERLYRRDRAR